VLYRCLSVRSVEYCTGPFVWGLEVCVHLVVGGVYVSEVRSGGFRSWGLCVFVIKSLPGAEKIQENSQISVLESRFDVRNLGIRKRTAFGLSGHNFTGG